MTSHIVGKCYFLAFLVLIILRELYDIWTFGFSSPYQITGIIFSILFSSFIMAYTFEIPVSKVISRTAFYLTTFYALYLLFGIFGNTEIVIGSLWKIAMYLPGYYMLFELSSGFSKVKEKEEIDPIVEKLRQPAPWERNKQSD